MEDLIKAMGITEVEVSQLREGMAFRFVDRGDRFDMIEYFGGEKKVTPINMMKNVITLDQVKNNSEIIFYNVFDFILTF